MTDQKTPKDLRPAWQRGLRALTNGLMAMSERAYANSPIRAYEKDAQHAAHQDEITFAEKGLDHKGSPNRAYSILFTY